MDSLRMDSRHMESRRILVAFLLAAVLLAPAALPSVELRHAGASGYEVLGHGLRMIAIGHEGASVSLGGDASVERWVREDPDDDSGALCKRTTSAFPGNFWATTCLAAQCGSSLCVPNTWTDGVGTCKCD